MERRKGGEEEGWRGGRMVKKDGEGGERTVGYIEC